jgi:hypothetical protein
VTFPTVAGIVEGTVAGCVRESHMTQAKLISLTVPPALLARGFWIYVWRIILANGEPVHYVGMTGDTGSYKAGSPLKRVGDHLGFNEKSNPLRKYLEKKGCPPERCKEMELMAFGPIGKVPEDKELYKRERGKIAALEKALCAAMRAAEYEVLHGDPRCNFECDPAHWSELKTACARKFPRLG